jgi:Dehydrogenases with different specificities (related to short-chain alcohol dehydrogenases)
MTTSAHLFDANFTGKIALVTGANSGIGLAAAKQLEQLGARVIRVDIQLTHLPPWQYAMDISQTSEINTLLNNIELSLGSIDLFVHAAGILKTGRLMDISIKDWQEIFSVNTLGAFYLCQQIGNRMAKLKRGSMVLVGSNCANTPRINIGAYAASKAASHQMLNCLGLELAEYGVRCNIVAPGSTDTPMQRRLWKKSSDEKNVIDGSVQDYRLGIPLKRLAQPENIANGICFLLSDYAQHITLETLTIDGGATLGCS